MIESFYVPTRGVDFLTATCVTDSPQRVTVYLESDGGEIALEPSQALVRDDGRTFWRFAAEDLAANQAVELSATVSAVRAQTVRFSWVNVTGHGRLVGNETGVTTSPFNIRWEAPANLDSGSVQVEVIQLVVTAISQVISVTDKGVQTTHDIASQTKTIPITITATQ